MADVRTLKLNLLADVNQFNKSLKTADNSTNAFSSKIGKYSKAMAKSFALAGAAAGAFAIKVGLDGVKSASDLNEEVSKAEVIFGDVSNEIKAFAKTADKALGLTQTEALKAASTFATFGKASGLAGKDLSKFSTGATKLASDLASFYNTNADEAITAIGAALRGEAEPIRKFGVLLNDSTLKAKAMEMGLYDGTGALDLQAKSLAAYQVILDQTKDAQGDFARTSDGLAGQQKILTAQLENLKTTMGTNLLPVMLRVVEQANFIAKAFGGNDPEPVSDLERIADLACNIAERAQDLHHTPYFPIPEQIPEMVRDAMLTLSTHGFFINDQRTAASRMRVNDGALGCTHVVVFVAVTIHFGCKRRLLSPLSWMESMFLST